jgi:hypothetical protein
MLSRFLEGDASIPSARICRERALLIADDAAAAKASTERARGI